MVLLKAYGSRANRLLVWEDIIADGGMEVSSSAGEEQRAEGKEPGVDSAGLYKKEAALLLALCAWPFALQTTSNARCAAMRRSEASKASVSNGLSRNSSAPAA